VKAEEVLTAEVPNKLWDIFSNQNVSFVYTNNLTFFHTNFFFNFAFFSNQFFNKQKFCHKNFCTVVTPGLLQKNVKKV